MNSPEENANEISDLTFELQHSYQRMIEEINQLTAKANDLTWFCDAIVYGITNVFKYYSVNLYIVDSKREWAVLKAGTSNFHQDAIQHGHKLAIDIPSLISQVVNTGSPWIGKIEPDDTPILYSSVDLPIHSELCVPLISQQKNIIGVLDVQSEEYKAFRKEDFIFYMAIVKHIVNVLEDKAFLTGYESKQ